METLDARVQRAEVMGDDAYGLEDLREAKRAALGGVCAGQGRVALHQTHSLLIS